MLNPIRDPVSFQQFITKFIKPSKYIHLRWELIIAKYTLISWLGREANDSWNILCYLHNNAKTSRASPRKRRRIRHWQIDRRSRKLVLRVKFLMIMIKEIQYESYFKSHLSSFLRTYKFYLKTRKSRLKKLPKQPYFNVNEWRRHSFWRVQSHLSKNEIL